MPAKENNQIQVRITNELLVNDFETETSRYADSELNFEILFNELCNRIQYLLNHDFEKLVNICYRVDVDEKLFREALDHSEPGKIAPHLSKIILERFKKKAEFRMKYSGS
jgi:hypothetical protein